MKVGEIWICRLNCGWPEHIFRIGDSVELIEYDLKTDDYNIYLLDESIINGRKTIWVNRKDLLHCFRKINEN